MEQGVWQEIELLYQKFQKLGISEAVDYDKYYLYWVSGFSGLASFLLFRGTTMMHAMTFPRRRKRSTVWLPRLHP